MNSLKVVSGGSELLVRGVTRFDLFLINRDVFIFLMLTRCCHHPAGLMTSRYCQFVIIRMILGCCNHNDSTTRISITTREDLRCCHLVWKDFVVISIVTREDRGEFLCTVNLKQETPVLRHTLEVLGNSPVEKVFASKKRHHRNCHQNNKTDYGQLKRNLLFP